MNPGGGVTTTFRSVLDKPLHQLTEEDISQVTREDCRNFLKEKGMRRPSWNKSQAIQQVICLKSLLETSENPGAGDLRRFVRSSAAAAASPENQTNVTSNSADSVKEPSNEAQISVSAEESAPYRRKDAPKSALSGELACPPSDTDDKAVSPRSPGSTNWSVGQMTIFYCGKVNVYDGMPADKARTIMHLAASPIHFSQDDPFSGTRTPWSVPFHVSTTAVNPAPLLPSVTITQTMQSEKISEYPQQCREERNVTCEPEGHADRKLSLQRYLEKRKDRFKSRKKIGLSSSGMEMYLNLHLKTQTTTAQSNWNSTWSSTQPETWCSAADAQANNDGLSVDLNNKDIEEN